MLQKGSCYMWVELSMLGGLLKKIACKRGSVWEAGSSSVRANGPDASRLQVKMTIYTMDFWPFLSFFLCLHRWRRSKGRGHRLKIPILRTKVVRRVKVMVGVIINIIIEGEVTPWGNIRHEKALAGLKKNHRGIRACPATRIFHRTDIVTQPQRHMTRLVPLQRALPRGTGKGLHFF